VTTGADAYDGPLSAIRNHADDLGAWLAIWSVRDDGKPDAHARRCASDAVDAIDAMLTELHCVRARLVGEIRDGDDAAAARSGARPAGRRRLMNAGQRGSWMESSTGCSAPCAARCKSRAAGSATTRKRAAWSARDAASPSPTRSRRSRYSASSIARRTPARNRSPPVATLAAGCPAWHSPVRPRFGLSGPQDDACQG